MAPPADSLAADGDVALSNRRFYDGLWSETRLARPERFNTWPLIEGLLPHAPARLEVGPGLRPRLPIAGSHFIDMSSPVIGQLNSRGALAELGDAAFLPYQDETFDLVCAFDVVEHVADDLAAFAELSRVLKKDGTLVFSVPLHSALWTAFDDLVGHVRRYDLHELEAAMRQNGLVPQRSAVFGMQPSNQRLLQIGIWFLTHRRASALFWYDRIFLPLSLLFQKPLEFAPGLPVRDGAAEVLLVCRRG